MFRAREAIRSLPDVGGRQAKVGTKAQQPDQPFGEACLVVSMNVDEPVLPSASGTAIDLAHLARMTLGERSLEREVLALFDRQTELLLPRIAAGAPAAATLAHTLKGSALGIGAFRVARAAEAVEQASGPALATAIEALGAAIAESRIEIARLLRTERAAPDLKAAS
jgi:HPt (histidine-containing phosphotransfer) domain-containing protein